MNKDLEKFVMSLIEDDHQQRQRIVALEHLVAQLESGKRGGIEADYPDRRKALRAEFRRLTEAG